ncbi:TPA: hypothetical protein KRI07_003841, partial [Clostridioides difficile]|nr:hypothetical protein [Clostridioides difficile]
KKVVEHKEQRNSHSWRATIKIYREIRRDDEEMEWLRKILEGIKIEENKFDIEEILKSVNTEFPKHAVPKETFNKVNE